VVIWLRPPGRPLDDARREVNRPARLRWVAGGRHDGQEWDAFLAPAGYPLPDLVAQGGPLPWPRVRHLLEQLTDELAAAGDGTLPGELTPGQVWVRPDGGVQLLDLPPGLFGAAADLCPDAGDSEQRSLGLLGQVAFLALEGAARPASDPWVPVRAPLPVHAARLVNGLLPPGPRYRRLEEFQADLAATRDRPAEVTRGRRAGQVSALATMVLTSCCWWWILVLVLVSPPFFGLTSNNEQIRAADQALGELEAGAAHELAASALHPDPWVRLAAACRWEEDRRLAERLRVQMAEDRRALRGRMKCLSPFPRRVLRDMNVLEELSPAEPDGPGGVAAFSGEDFRFKAELALAMPRALEAVGWGPSQPFPAMVVGALACLLWLSAWAVVAFLARGGVSFLLVGIVVVRRDGRRASRLRCAGRAVLAWAPVAALLLLGVCLDAWHVGTWRQLGYRPWLWWLAAAAWWSAEGLLPAYAALALWSPARSLHDRLAGTCLVPR
jgi:hypothetical protein